MKRNQIEALFCFILTILKKSAIIKKEQQVIRFNVKWEKFNLDIKIVFYKLKTIWDFIL